jgi:hypothetical protein
MRCPEALDKLYETFGDEGAEDFSLLDRLELGLHLFLCPRCGEERRKLEAARGMMGAGFFPPAPDFEEALMARVLDEEGPEASDAPTGVSFRGWVITGCVILVSLSLSCFGIDFIWVARSQGSSFLLPLGLTIGGVLTGYGALFIGSHLKELSARFGLR